VRDAKHASVPLRRVRAGELRREEFLYELKAGPAGGRLRRPSSRRQRRDGHRGTGLAHPSPEYAHLVAIPAFTHRGFWTRIVVFGASLLVYAWGVRLMAREQSIVGVLGIAVFSLLILFSGGGLIATLMSRSPRRSR
jgi:hypothetical protein